MFSRLRRKSRILLRARTVLLVGTGYVALCTLAIITLFPHESLDNNQSQPSKLEALQGDVWQGSSKRGGRPRNIFFSSEGHEEDVNPHARLESNLSLDHRTENNSKTFREKVDSNNEHVPLTSSNNFRPTELSDIFIGIKTTEKYHDSRLPVIFDTWLDNSQVRRQTYIFSDADESKYYKETNGHFINTHCVTGHTRKGLCCKMGAIFSTYLKSEKRWWCTVDDDNYLNVDNLLKLLQSYHHDKDYYLGRSSTSSKIVVYDVGDKRNLSKKEIYETRQNRRQTSFWFATGGAGVCISRSLALKMSPYAGIGEFPVICDRINLPDDVSIGFLIDDLLGVHLTKISDMHAHLNTLKNLKEAQINSAITLSYKFSSDTATNCISLKGAAFNTTEDPTRFKSLHCKLHPEAKICPRV